MSNRGVVRRGRVVAIGVALALALCSSASGQVLQRLRKARDAGPAHEAAALIGLKPEAGYRLEHGPYKVDNTDLLVLHDAARDKDLEMTVRTPKGVAAGTKLPLVVFSHGMGGNRKAFAELTEHWASYGYVVILPTHDDSIELQKREGKDISGFYDKSKVAQHVNMPMRVADMKFVLDSLDQIEEKTASLGKGRIDRERIAVAGHSAGALTAEFCIGMKARSRESVLEARSIGDERFKAAIIVSGHGVSGQWITKDAWKDIARPMLVITGSLDTVPISDETPATRRQPYEFASPGDKYLMFITGANHMSYQGKNRMTQLRGGQDSGNFEAIGSIVSAGTTAFLDAYLGKSAEAKAYLLSDKLEQFSGGVLEWDHK